MLSLAQESSTADQVKMAPADGVNEPAMTQALSAVCCLPEAPSWPQVTDLSPAKGCGVQPDYVTSSGRLSKMAMVPTQGGLLLTRAVWAQPRLAVLPKGRAQTCTLRF